MPKKPSGTVWTKASLSGMIVDANDVNQIKNAVNTHRAYITSQSSQYHNNLLSGNYGFTSATNRDNPIRYDSVNDIKKAINAFYYGNGVNNKPYADTSTNLTGQPIRASDFDDLRRKVNYVETNCVSCDSCQFSTWSGNWSGNWSGQWSGQWSSNWSGQWSSNWSGQWSSNDCYYWSGNWSGDVCPACPDATWSGAWHSNV